MVPQNQVSVHEAFTSAVRSGTGSSPATISVKASREIELWVNVTALPVSAPNGEFILMASVDGSAFAEVDRIAAIGAAGLYKIAIVRGEDALGVAVRVDYDLSSGNWTFSANVLRME